MIIFIIGILGILLVTFNLGVRKEVKKYYDFAVNAYLKTQKGVPILSYHGVDIKPWGIKEYFVSPEEFEKQIKFLKDNGYTAIGFDKLGDFKKYDKPVIITFDDGYKDLYKYAYPVLKKYNMRATLFMVSDFVGQRYYLNVSELKKMSDVFDIQSHTKTHPELAKTSSYAIDLEMSHSKLELSELLSKQVYVVSYPYSKVDQKVIDYASKYYSYGILNWGGKYYGFEGPYKIPRIPIHWDDTLEIFIQKIS